MSINQPQRILNIGGVLNFRDLGGYKTVDGREVKWRKMFRSAQLDRLNEQGIAKLTSLKVRAVVDLRFSEETHKYPTIKEAVPEAKIISWHDVREPDSGTRSSAIKQAWRESIGTKDPAQVREAMRVNYPQKLYSHRNIYRAMLQLLADGQTPLIFHCAAGKDRTGIAAALILSLLGVNDEQIIADYLLTQSELEGRVESWFAGGATSSEGYQDFQKELAEQSAKVKKPIFDADISYIQTLLEYVAETYGDFATYTKQTLGLDNDFVEVLKKRLLTK